MSGVWDYFTPEQQNFLSGKIEQVRRQIGPEALKSLSREAEGIIAKLRDSLLSGIPADHPDTVAAAGKLEESQVMFNDGDPELEKAVERFHVENPDTLDHGIDLKLYRYMEEAKSHLPGKEGRS